MSLHIQNCIKSQLFSWSVTVKIYKCIYMEDILGQTIKKAEIVHSSKANFMRQIKYDDGVHCKEL